MMTTCLRNIGLLLNPRPDGSWVEIRQAALLFDHCILAVAPEVDLLPKLQADVEIVDAGGALVTPGFVDSHTHPAFIRHRADEFELRNRGRTYQQIAAAGGGIRASVRAVRAASEDELVERMLPRLDNFLLYGTTTIEAKSGYGLSTEHELKQLRAIQRCHREHPLDLIPTLLAAHETPDEYRDKPDQYVDLVVQETIPAAAEANLARFCDVFCEEGVFSVEQARRVLLTGREYGLLPKLHAEQLSDTGGAALAAEVGAVSADHLDYVSDQNLDRMVAAGVIFSLLPGAVIFLGLHRYPPTRRIMERGGKLALATDFNPGSSPTQNLPLMMTLAGSFCKLSVREALWAATHGGAEALQLAAKIGSLNVGCAADLVLWNCADESLIPYYFGMNLVHSVYKGGKLVVQQGKRI